MARFTLDGMTDFFDDPEFAEQLARRGITHKPGMADDLLKELAPLLKAEGVDLDDPDNVPDLDTLNAAMAVAVERHNMHLHTPVGAHRDLALAVLREIAVGIGTGNSDYAVDVFDSIAPEETDVRPAGSHVIGVGLGLLDEWYADPSILPEVMRNIVPKLFSKPSRNVARDIVSLAMKGRAIASIDQLIRRNGGLVVAEATVLAVSGALIARAKARNTSVAELGAEALTAIELPANRTGASFSNEPAPETLREIELDRQALNHEPLLRGLREWLDGEDFLDYEADELVADLLSLFSFLRKQGRPIEEPGDVEMAAWALGAAEVHPDDEAAEDVLLGIDTLVHFHMVTSRDPEAWDEVHDAIMGMGPTEINLSPLVEEAEQQTRTVSTEERLAAFTETRLYSATNELIEWVGERGQSVTATGVPRRADIARVAGMFGIDAIGVAKSPPPGEQGDVRHVKSMIDIPELLIWWDAVAMREIIEVTKTRVRLGGQGERLHAGGEWSMAGVENLIEDCVVIGVSQLCAPETGADGFVTDPRRLNLVVTAFVLAFEGESLADFGEGDLAVKWRAMRAVHLLESLRDLGIVEGRGENFVIPTAWRAPISRGLHRVVMTIQ